MTPRASIALALLAALLLALVAFVEGDRTGREAVRLEWQTADALEAAERARRREQAAKDKARQMAQIQEDQDAHLRKVAAAAADARSARGELDRLREQLFALSRSGAAACRPQPSAIPDGAAAAPELLGQCSAELQRVAGEADRLSVQLSGLQAYVNAIAGGPSDGSAKN